MSTRIAMIGAGSGFTLSVANPLCKSEILKDATFVLMDPNAQRAEVRAKEVRDIAAKAGAALRVETTTDLRYALEGARFVVTACEKNRGPYWIRDLEIPRAHGVHQLLGENGGPGGQAHALRNITMFMEICAAIREVAPDAWLLNFTNPMSFLCTYLQKRSGVKAMGFCHQVHGSFGVVAEMLGFEPGELQVITGGINHMNFLMDIRKRGTGESFMVEFLERVRQSEWWQKNRPLIPEQTFTLEVLEAFGVYPVGYDGHIVEYIPFFHEPERWAERGFHPYDVELKKYMEYDRRKKEAREKAQAGLQETHLQKVEMQVDRFPFPRDPEHSYYKEDPAYVMEALLTNTPAYFDAMVLVNHGAIDNLPADAVVDVPALVVGGEARGVHVGALPPFAAELCRRQIAIHELVVDAAMTGNRQLALQAMALDPYVRSLTQAKRILADFLQEYAAELPQFHR